MAPIDSLIERLEKATGPDRELDGDIAVAVHGGEIVWRTYPNAVEQYPARKYASTNHVGGFGFTPVDPYTASLDAALTLVPGNRESGTLYRVQLECNDPDSYWEARVRRHARDWSESGLCVNGAIALSIAALKARKERI